MAFAKRFQSDGTESAVDPSAELDIYLPDGVVIDKVFVERFEPEAKHNQEVLDEDDAFLGMAAPEVWEYHVVDSRAEEFVDAVRNSGTVMQIEVIDSTVNDESEITTAPLADSASRAPDSLSDPDDLAAGGSGVRSVDDGPGGQPTGDPSAGGLTVGARNLALDEVDGIANDGSGALDDLTIVSADDPNLGLTNYERVGPDDWAADTGPTRTPDRGVSTERLGDRSSTLAPKKK